MMLYFYFQLGEDRSRPLPPPAGLSLPPSPRDSITSAQRLSELLAPHLVLPGHPEACILSCF